jgi:hypothetical protein
LSTTIVWPTLFGSCATPGGPRQFFDGTVLLLSAVATVAQIVHIGFVCVVCVCVWRMEARIPVSVHPADRLQQIVETQRCQPHDAHVAVAHALDGDVPPNMFA